MKEVTGELRRRIEAEEHERRTANQQNQLRWVKGEAFHNLSIFFWNQFSSGALVVQSST